MSSGQIETKLFELLKDVGQLIEKTAEESKDKNAQLVILEIRDKLTVFCKNFFIQFFYGGYGYRIDGINYDTMKKINDFFSFRSNVPTRMIETLSKYVYIHVDIMGDPYTKETLTSKKLYCHFLPDLFGAFKEDGLGVIDNFAEVVPKMDETLRKIEATCKKWA